MATPQSSQFGFQHSETPQPGLPGHPGHPGHPGQTAQPRDTSAELSAMEREAERDRQESGAAWGFLWVLLAFKLITVAMIFWADISTEAGVLLSATTWYWSIIPILATAGPVVYRLRLRRARRRRALLQRAEWVLER